MNSAVGLAETSRLGVVHIGKDFSDAGVGFTGGLCDDEHETNSPPGERVTAVFLIQMEVIVELDKFSGVTLIFGLQTASPL